MACHTTCSNNRSRKTPRPNRKERSTDELEIILVAIRDHNASNASQISFATGDLIIYLPQRGMVLGLGVGRVGGNEGLFRLDATKVTESMDAPPALELAQHDAQRVEDEPQLVDQWLPPGDSVRQVISLVLNEPESCRLAKVVSVWVMTLIQVSTLAFMLETLPQFHVDGVPDLTNPLPWNNLEPFIVVQFSVEYGLRLITCERVCKFIFEPMNVIDLAAIGPWYLEALNLAGSQSAVLRVFRLTRVIRIFKLGKYAAGLQLFGRTIVSSMDALMLLFFFLAIATILASSVMYFFERGTWSVAEQQWLRDDGEPSQFTSIPATFWWCVVTLTTTGYGDIVPVTLQGQLLAVCTMLAGVFTIALPVSILGSNFQLESQKLEKNKKRKEAALKRHVVRLTMARELQEELGKLGGLFSELDGLTRLAQEKQGALLRIANSQYFHEETEV